MQCYGLMSLTTRACSALCFMVWNQIYNCIHKNVVASLCSITLSPSPFKYFDEMSYPSSLKQCSIDVSDYFMCLVVENLLRVELILIGRGYFAILADDKPLYKWYLHF